jgi:hypothetical protein
MFWMLTSRESQVSASKSRCRMHAERQRRRWWPRDQCQHQSEEVPAEWRRSGPDSACIRHHPSLPDYSLLWQRQLQYLPQNDALISGNHQNKQHHQRPNNFSCKSYRGSRTPVVDLVSSELDWTRQMVSWGNDLHSTPLTTDERGLHGSRCHPVWAH